MNLSVNSKGLLTFSSPAAEQISPSPIGLLIMGGNVLSPTGATVCQNRVTVCYGEAECIIDICHKEKYVKLTLADLPEEADGFVFGPYATNAKSFGEILGAGWNGDGSAVCIQSLMPKVSGGAKVPYSQNQTCFDLENHADAATENGGKVHLQCSVRNLTRGGSFDYLGMENAQVLPVPSPDGHPRGASVALVYADGADGLLDAIEALELAEGLPHPTYKGEYVKRSKKAAALYLIIDDPKLTNEERIRYAGRAGASCVYFAGVLEKWGHYTLNSAAFPGGIPDLKAQTDLAAEHGVTVGAHTLSNFIHPHDEYVSPLPHKDLLVMDETELTRPLSETDSEIFILEEKNFSKNSEMNTARIGSELVTFEGFDPEEKKLTGCTRGAFGTAVSAHPAGEKISRLWDHGYKTFFPNFALQAELAQSIGNIIRDCGLGRMSFDGLEGCLYSGVGDYGPAEFVRTVFETTGNGLVADASILSHYLWHAFSYCNWGEPWYDHVRRGGLYALRAGHIPYFKRNLIPAMMGWYTLWDNRGRYEATSPENMEFMLSRMAAFDAGIALNVDGSAARTHGKFGEYLDLAKLWSDFRLNAEISDGLREKMQDENSNWHLEQTEEGWKLYDLVLRTNDLDYCDRTVKTEAGYWDNKASASSDTDLISHSTVLWLDFPYSGFESEPLRFRIRVGEPGHGMLCDPDFGFIKFSLTALGGDYLVYNGGTEIEHYDANYNLKAVVKGEGTPVQTGFSRFAYLTDADPLARYTLTEIRVRDVHTLKRK